MGMSPLPAGMVQTPARLVVHRRVARDHFLMRFKAPLVARRARAGQFIHLRCSADPSDTFPLLRRPLSIMEANSAAGTVDVVYKVMGLGTETLSRIPAGVSLDLLGPLGRPFEIPTGLETGILVGGGVGIPPMVFLARELLRQKKRVVAFLGARTGEWVICRPQFEALGVEVEAATDDGTLGRRGSVVDLVDEFFFDSTRSAKRSGQQEWRSAYSTENPAGGVGPSPSRRSRCFATVMYVCGPTPMMKAAADLARREGVPCQVSLEERMGCAMGCCMGCVVEVTTEPAGSHARFQRVCTEGPVFPAEAVAWR